MNLRKRISKLREDGHNVTVNEYGIFNFDGYDSHKAIRNFWIGACIFLVLALGVFWIGFGIFTDSQVKMNPEASKIQMEREKQARELEFKSRQNEEELYLKNKKLYIDGCKDAGKSPGDMSDNKANWGCR